MSIPDEQRQKVYDWLDTPPNQRILSKKEFRESMRLSSKVFRVLVEDFHIEKKLAEKQLIEGQTAQARKGINDTLAKAEKNALDGIDYDSEGWLGTRTERADKALVKACEDGSAAALKIYYQLTKRLVEKAQQGVKTELSADEIARRNLEAERQLREAGYRVEEVPKKFPLLPEDICEDTPPR